MTYALRVTTDGDDGCLEVYDQHGLEIGVGRTYLELISWGNVDEIRTYLHDYDFPANLNNKEQMTVWQFGGYAIYNGSPERCVVVAEEIPEEKQDEAIQIICVATGVREKAITAVLDSLPRSVTRNIAQEKAEDIWHQLITLGVKASIEEFQGDRWAIIKRSDFTDG
ncbi:hypothetical protein [Nostoc sp. TCL26-01]|uniref:hypothetical protein n=1 Tax=Nostoc sp. TCL26-01 TaxID=2576904 RepID=UPI0015B957F4|nr:hypothetical protein [Nostoc sp. TCL26-01]QLE56277.1 hypothetical protein FD725_12430 [Nostoc sp. TCL26-01]